MARSVTPPAVACGALASGARFGSLATVACDPEGWPFATLAVGGFGRMEWVDAASYAGDAGEG
jgi:hypothetical protein